jgi:hypothetical protein
MLESKHTHPEQLDNGYYDLSWVRVAELAEYMVQLDMHLGV